MKESKKQQIMQQVAEIVAEVNETTVERMLDRENKCENSRSMLVFVLCKMFCIKQEDIAGFIGYKSHSTVSRLLADNQMWCRDSEYSEKQADVFARTAHLRLLSTFTQVRNITDQLKRCNERVEALEKERGSFKAQK